VLSVRTRASDPRWEAFAAAEPYFAVLTAQRFRRAHLTAADEHDFFESGENFVRDLFRTIDVRFTPDFAPMSILEYGCGVGRLAIPFARRAESITAVDRSTAMLNVARQEAQRHGVEGIHFCAPGEVLDGRRKFDLINCTLVLQRIPHDEGFALLRQLLGLLGAGGIGVFQFPYRTRMPRVVGAFRWLQESVPAINRLANVLRHRPFQEPFIATHIYGLDDVLRTLHDASFPSTHVVFEHQPGFDGAIAFVQAPPSFTVTEVRDTRTNPASHPGTDDADRLIDVRHKIAHASTDELNAAAEQYFASLTDWEHHLAKPFSHPEETPRLLLSVATMLQGLRLVPGMTVLEFGAGTGWLARFLTQLGCRVILLDVSPTALRIAQAHYDRVPVVGDRPPPQFLQFDGRQIDVPDVSVERIVSLNAFHHVPNPHSVLLEFWRILTPGGIVGFAEPGPHHSRTPQSQFEMGTHAVVENDVNVHDIWRAAHRCGFKDLKLAVYQGTPFHVSIQEYEDLLAGGVTCARWVTSTRDFLRSVRSFFLYKEGSDRADSRSESGLGCDIRVTLVNTPDIEGEPLRIDATVTNSGSATWLPSDVAYGGVLLGAHLYDAGGALVSFDFATARLTDPPREIAPGETVDCSVRLQPLRPGRYLLQLDCVAAHVAWFAQIGSQPAIVPLDII
jgi:2-polyprenyl-3-methyl-5-hydroxy-6-metoxy-1,4-benzoquinol methylase